MNIGIIGSGNVGSMLGEVWAKAGHQVMFSFSRHPERLQTLANKIGSNAMSGTSAEAVNFADIVLFAPNFWLAQEAIASDDEAAKTIVAQLAEDSGGRPFDLGSLRNASLIEIPGAFSSSDNLTLDAAFKQRLQVLGY
jgi:predicted dinucleotide-binding enzyme